MIQYSLEVAICWSVLYLVYIIFLKRETFFSVNRAYLLGSLMVGLIIPFIRMIDWQWQKEVTLSEPLEFISAGPSYIASTVRSTPVVDSFSISPIQVITCIYVIGVLFMTTRFIFGMNKIYRLFKEGIKTKKDHFILVETNSYHLPFSFLNYVFFSKAVNFNEEIKHIIHHELTHIKSRHSIDVLFVEVLHIIFWWNPLIYLYKKEIRQVHEYAADAMVLTDTNQKIYGQILLGQSESGLEIALAHQFFHSHLKQRIMMMYKKKSGRSALVKYLTALPVILCLCILFSFSYSTFIVEENKEKVEQLMDDFFATDTRQDWESTQPSILVDGKYQKKESALSLLRKLIFQFPEEAPAITERFSFEASLNGIMLTFNDDTGTSFCQGWNPDLDREITKLFATPDLSEAKLIETRIAFIEDYPEFASFIEDRFQNELNKPEYQKSISKTPLTLINGKEYEVPGETFEEKWNNNIDIVKQYNSTEILSGKQAVDKFGDIAKDRTVFNLFNDVKSMIITNDNVLAVFKKNNKWIAEYQSNYIGELSITINDHLFKKLSSHLLNKQKKKSTIELESLNIGDKTFQIVVKQEGDGRSVSSYFFNLDNEEKRKKDIDEYYQKSDLYYKTDTIPNRQPPPGGKPGLINYLKRDKANIMVLIDDIEVTKHEVIKRMHSLSFHGYNEYDMNSQRPIMNFRTENYIYKVSEVMARFPGCEDMSGDNKDIEECAKEKMLDYIYANLEYPEEAIKKGTEGMNIVQFVIDTNGNVTEPKLVRDIGDGTGAAALKVVENMPKWRPAYQKGKVVPLLYTLPVRFKLDANNQHKDQGLNKDNGLDESRLANVTNKDKSHGGRPDNTKNHFTSYPMNTQSKTIACKPNNDGYYFAVEKRPILKECESVVTAEECGSTCSHETLSERFLNALELPDEVIAEGYQGMLSWTLLINEKGTIDEIKKPRNIKLDFGLAEATDKALKEAIASLTFTPATCEGNEVPSMTFLSANVKLTKKQIANVPIRDKSTVDNPFQSVTFRGAQPDGGLGFFYTTNMNVPYEIQIIDPNDNVVYTKSGDYIYKQTYEYFKLENPINGTYKLVAIQDGLQTEATMDVTVFNKKI